MKKQLRRFIAMFLALSMAIGMIHINASAEGINTSDVEIATEGDANLDESVDEVDETQNTEELDEIVEPTFDATQGAPIESITDVDNTTVFLNDKDESGHYEFMTPWVSVKGYDANVFDGEPGKVADDLRNYYEGFDFEFRCESDPNDPDIDWEVGEHTAILSLYVDGEKTNVSATYTVNVIENPIEEVIISDPVTVYQGTEVDKWGYDDPIEGWQDIHWYGYDMHPTDVTITLNNGDDPIIGDLYDVCDEFRYRYSVDLRPRVLDEIIQGPDELPDLGEYDVTCQVGQLYVHYAVIVAESPIESVYVEGITLFSTDVEHQTDWYNPETDEWIEVEWDRYRTWPDYIKVSLTDGEYFEGNPHDVRDQIADYFQIGDFRFGEEEDQSPTNKWEAGDHNIPFYVMDKSVDYDVCIVQSPVKSVKVNDVNLLEGDYQNRDGYFDPESESWISDVTWQAYDTWPANGITVELDPEIVGTDVETTLTGDANDVRRQLAEITGQDENSFSFGSEDDQVPNPDTMITTWTTSIHTVDFNVMGVRGSYQISIYDNPIVSLEQEDFSLLESACYEETGYWPHDGQGDPDIKWMKYDEYPHNLTATLDDGTVYENKDWAEIKNLLEKKTGCSLRDWSESDQKPNEQDPSKSVWSVGSVNPVVFHLGPATCEYNIEIVPGFIESVEVTDMTWFLYDREYRDRYWDEETHQDVFSPWWAYKTWPNEIKVTLTEEYDSQVFEGEANDVRHQIADTLGMDERDIDFHVEGDDQTPSSVIWDIGTHDLQFYACGATADYSVVIVDNPIELIEATDFSVFAGDYVHDNWYYDEDEQRVDAEWEKYDTYPHNITVTLKDEYEGLVFEGNPWDISNQLGEKFGITGIMFEIFDDQMPDPETMITTWEPGSHVCDLSFGGAGAGYNVTVTESPIESITVSDIYRLEGDTFTEYGYWPPEGQGDPEVVWERYDTWPNDVKVTFVDGITYDDKDYFEGNLDDVIDVIADILKIDREDVRVDFRDDQNPTTPWGIGRHNSELQLAGVKATYGVNIVGNPIESIDVERVEDDMDDNDYPLGGYFDEFGRWVDDPDFKGYDIFPRPKGEVDNVITITWTDSTTSTGDMFDLMGEVRERLVEAGQLPEDANIRMDWRVWHDQTPENTWEPGYHQVMLRYCGVDSYYDVLVFGERGSYYGLATEGDDWVYCEDGFVSTTTTGFEKGPVADTFTKTEEGRIPTHYVEDTADQYYYVIDGVVDTTFTGPVTGTIDGLKAWYYVTEGKLDREFKGFALVGSSWMYFTNGFVDKTLNADHYGTFWGTVDGVSGWYVVKKGKAYPEFKGFALVGESWYYFTDGQIDKTLNEDFYGTVYGTVGEEKGYFVVKKGKVYPEYTGFALVGSSWMYYKDGKMDKSVTGARIINIKGDKRWYYVKSGKVIMDYTGFAEVSSSTMYFKNGKIDKTVTGIFTGTINGVKAQYYVKKGVFQKTYTGTLKQDGYKYTIKNGKVTKKEKI